MSKIRYVCLNNERRDVMYDESSVVKIIGERVMAGFPVRQVEITDCPDGSRVSVAWQLGLTRDAVWCVYIQEV